MARPRILPPAYFFGYLILEVAAHYILPIAQLISSPVRWSGLVLIIVGVWLNMAAAQRLQRHKTTVKPHEKPSSLVSQGPYRISRNPMYLGMLLILLGEAIILGSLSPFLAPVAFFLTVDTIFVWVEEKTLLEVFGEEYAAYKKRVRRWV